MVNVHFTCIGRSHGAPAIPATREQWEKMRKEPWLADMCRRILNGEEKLKSMLPVWTPGCAEFKDNHRAIADAVKPLRRLMLDFDEKGHSQEILEKSKQLQGEGKWDILLVEESVRKGTHVLIALPEGMTPQEAQARFSNDVGFQADPALKDTSSRCIYMVPDGYTLYVNEERLCAAHADGKQGTHEGCPYNETANEHVTATVGAGSARPNTTTNTTTNATTDYPSTYEDIPYESIVETLEEQMGGRPEHGSRNNFIFSMACHLRYITNDDAAWIAQILPDYGEGREKWLNSIKSACNRSQTKTMPRIMKRTLAICKERNSELITQNSELDSPPPLPRRLPPLIKLLVSRTPKIYQPAVANAVFPALGAHFFDTRFRYIDNCAHEATLACVLMAPTGSGKSCVNTPIDYIMADIRERDEKNMEQERKWRLDTQSKGANKDKKNRPSLPIQFIDADITSAAFTQRMADAEGRFLYLRMNEISQLYNLSNKGNADNLFDLLCVAFDYGNLWGQTRVSAASVSERVTVRLNYNVSTTIRKGQYFFRNVLTDGPISRINICSIPERPIGSEMPIYGTYDESFAEELKPYIDRLNAARGWVVCPQVNRLAKKLVEECAEFARLSQSRVYENLSFRANVIAFLKAMVLYVAHGEKWDKSMEDFVRWSLQYDMYYKMKFFGNAIGHKEEADAETFKSKGPQNLLDLLPEVFTREEAQLMRAHQGIREDNVRLMLSNWKKRGYIEEYGAIMPQGEVMRQRYIKTPAYLEKHPQAA